eukprot:TRINITY_DN3464_c0_g1_i1.p2 TRINITY_DN3464_c0_g1~~TRINITY_DN3464_c0_g1_i1.p2  ORF type:complete len:228 (-),score=21.74 TRINITY_DN3464_c0_g1_i1:350-1033(-)
MLNKLAAKTNQVTTFHTLQTIFTCLSRCFATQVLVPRMGESIEEGTIAAILKKQGEQVQEDETLLQIDTDKVTIDVRAPVRGTVEHILVQEEDTVSVGQLIAMLGEPVPQGLEVPVESKPTVWQSSKIQDQTNTGYVPSIRFPPRVTPEGVRVSDLPYDQATAFIQKWEQSLSGRIAQEPSQISKENAIQTKQPQGKKRVTTESVHPARRTLSEREMEMIELGGAFP